MKAIRNLAAVMLVLSVAAVGACSKSNDKVTNPGGGGGAKELNSGNIAGSGAFPHTFNTAGVFGYHCSIHPGMVGSVTVQAGSPTTPVAISIVNMTTGFSPNAVTVGPGTQVTWTNNDVTNHTVTSD